MDGGEEEGGEGAMSVCVYGHEKRDTMCLDQGSSCGGKYLEWKEGCRVRDFTFNQ